MARMQLPARRESAAEARAFVATTVRSWGHDSPIHDLLLVVSELVTNAVLHTDSGEMDMAVVMHGDTIRVEVSDASATPPRPAAKLPGTDDMHGRGLLLVDAVAEEWGVEQRAGGKHVWAEVS